MLLGLTPMKKGTIIPNSVGRVSSVGSVSGFNSQLCQNPATLVLTPMFTPIHRLKVEHGYSVELFWRILFLHFFLQPISSSVNFFSWIRVSTHSCLSPRKTKRGRAPIDFLSDILCIFSWILRLLRSMYIYYLLKHTNNVQPLIFDISFTALQSYSL